MADNILNHPEFNNFAARLEQDRGLPAGLLGSLIYQESRGNPAAISPVGAQGVAQFMPPTAKEYKVDVTNPWDSTRGAADYLGDLVKQYQGNVQAALAHYNGGTAAGRAVLAGKAPPSLETQKYIPAVMGRMSQAQASPDAAQAADYSQITPQVVSQTRDAVKGMVQKGLAPDLIVGQLFQSINKPVVAQMRSAGYSDLDIINEIGGKPVQDILSANQQVGKQNFLENAWDGAKNSVGDTYNGVKQLAARVGMGDLASLQREQAAREADPVRQAVSKTAGGTIGAITPTALALAIPGVGEAGVGTTVLGTAARSAALGSTLGALTPTTGDGQFLPNVLGGAALGGGVGAGTHLLGNALGSIGNKIGSTLTSDTRQADLARAINAKIGQTGDVVNSDISNAAHNDISALFTKAAQGESVTIPNGFGANVAKLAGDLDSSPKVLNRLTSLADGATVPAQDLLNVRSTLVGKLRSQTIDGADKQVLGDIVDHIDNHLASALPQSKQDMLSTARDQYRHLMAVDNMIARTNDSGILTPQSFNSAIKQGSNRSAFVRGNAPYQDLQEQANGLKDNPGAISKLAESLSTVLAVHHPVLSVAKSLMQTGGSLGAGAGKTLAYLGDALNPSQATALAAALGAKAPGAEVVNTTGNLSPAQMALAKALLAK